MTTAFPEDVARRTTLKRPSYALGVLLNLLVPGAGFTYIGVWPLHIAWFFLTPILLGVAFVLRVQGSPLSLAALLGTLALLLFTYHLTYRAQARVAFQPAVSTVVQVVLGVGHAVVGTVLVGILAAVLIPNLLAVRERALEQQVARQMQVAVLAGGTPSRTCPPIRVTGAQRITACRVDLADPRRPGVSVTFRSGRTVTLP